jgi:hypothetical protein
VPRGMGSSACACGGETSKSNIEGAERRRPGGCGFGV